MTREEKCMAAGLLRDGGLVLEIVRKEIATVEPGTKGGIVFGRAGNPAPVIEFVENGDPLTVAALMIVLPRVGEQVVLNFHDGPRTCTVQNVRFLLKPDPALGSSSAQRLEKIEIAVHRTESATS